MAHPIVQYKLILHTIFPFLLQDVSDSNDMTALRRITGICPQHDILFDDLTCTEHLHLYGVIKGVHPDNIQNQVI